MNADNRIGSKHIPRITGMLLVRVFMDKELTEGNFKHAREKVGQVGKKQF